MIREARFCNSRKNRYLLKREWDASKRLILYIMFNPSLADDKQDDPTIRRLLSFSRKFNYGGFYVANLYTHITPNPKIIDSNIGVKKDNIEIIKSLINKVDDIVYAWGNSSVEPFELKSLIAHPLCFGKNINGTPKHPLYLPKNSKLISFRN
jgi:hypothetical protein